MAILLIETYFSSCRSRKNSIVPLKKINEENDHIDLNDLNLDERRRQTNATSSNCSSSSKTRPSKTDDEDHRKQSSSGRNARKENYRQLRKLRSGKSENGNENQQQTATSDTSSRSQSRRRSTRTRSQDFTPLRDQRTLENRHQSAVLGAADIFNARRSQDFTSSQGRRVSTLGAVDILHPPRRNAAASSSSNFQSSNDSNPSSFFRSMVAPLSKNSWNIPLNQEDYDLVNDSNANEECWEMLDVEIKQNMVNHLNNHTTIDESASGSRK
jgi:hypothetical protein